MTKIKTFSTISLILGIVALFTGWPGIIAIILGPIGNFKEERNGMAITGIILGAFAVVGWIICLIL